MNSTQLAIRRASFGRAIRLASVCAFALATPAFLAGCADDPPPSAPVANTAKPWLICAAGDVGGRLEPTACKVERPGGLARRAALLDHLREGYETVLVDVGGANLGDGPFDRLLWDAQLRGAVGLGIVAQNLGREEAALPADFRTQLAARTAIPWVSSNLRDASGAYVAEPLRVVERDGRTTVVLGILAPDRAPPELTADDPARAIETVLRDYDWKTRRPDALVVLLDADRSTAETLAARLPPWALVLRRGEDDSPTGEILATDPPAKPVARLIDVPARGEGVILAESATAQHAPIVEPAAVAPGWSVRVQSLEEKSPGMKPSAIAGFHRETARAGFTAADTRRVLAFAAQWKPNHPGEFESANYAGGESCRVCHQSESLACDVGPHSQAWQTLIDRGAQHDLRCQQCHTTGFAGAGNATVGDGFVSANSTPTLTAVRCEACHGPSAAHAADPLISTPWMARESCGRCHDREHSPGFFFEDAWLRIRHGERAAKSGEGRTFVAPKIDL